MATSETNDLSATLDKLEAESEHERVLEVLEVVRTIYENQQTLARKQSDSTERIERIELLATTFGTIDGIDGIEDPRDEAVVQAIQVSGEREFSLQELRHLYRAHTDVRNDATLKSRVKNLTQNGPFEYQGSQKWVYIGGPHINSQSGFDT